MSRRFSSWGLIAALLFGCQLGVAAEVDAMTERDPEDPSILRRPFSADEIRRAWVPGLVLELQRKTSEGERLERWTVMASDADGTYIEYATFDAEGAVTGEPRLERTAWVELRDHASFKADRSRREKTTRETALGTLDGWLYTVEDPESGTLSEFFFARSYPGAPVQVRVTRGEELIMELIQLARHRSE